MITSVEQWPWMLTGLCLGCLWVRHQRINQRNNKRQ